MIKFLDLQKINLVYQQEIDDRILETFRSGSYFIYQIKMSHQLSES